MLLGDLRLAANAGKIKAGTKIANEQKSVFAVPGLASSPALYAIVFIRKQLDLEVRTGASPLGC